MRLRRAIEFSVAVTIVALMSVPAPASAQAAEQPAPGVDTHGTTLGDALRAFAAILPLDIRLDPKVASIPVDVDVSGLTSYGAFRHVLLESGVDFVIVQRERRFSVMVGDAAEAPPLEPAAAGNSVTGLEPSEFRRADENDESDDVAVPAAGVEQGRAAGEMSGDDLAAILGGASMSDRAQARWVELPFPDANGQPTRVWRPAGTPSVVELPFTDSAGQPIVQVVPSRPPGVIELPFLDAKGLPILQVVPGPPGPAVSSRPGVVPGTRPPGARR